MHDIYLVQRGKINKVVNLTERLTANVNLDYMGSAEFEWGALPRSFRALETAFTTGSVMLTTIDIVGAEGKPLYVLHAITNPEDFVKYAGQLQDLYDYKIRTKEFTDFCNSKKMVLGVGKTDFWWDIENHVMFTFDAKFAKNIRQIVLNSIAYMNRPK